MPSTTTLSRSPLAPSPLTFADWSEQLRSRGLLVLPQSHPVPVDLWVRDAAGAVLHLRARGTRVVLRRYDASALATVLLRAECDCAEHRTAGAAGRVVLTPGAQPLAEAVHDGAREAGWTGVDAGRLRVPEAAELFDVLLPRLPELPLERLVDRALHHRAG